MNWLRRLLGGRGARSDPALDEARSGRAVRDADDLLPVEDGLLPAEDRVVVVPIADELDLHAFDPRDLTELLPDYLAQCRDAGLLRVRVIHGKGRGVLRRRVHAILRRLPDAVSFQLADGGSGSWGATIVRLRPREARLCEHGSEARSATSDD